MKKQIKLIEHIWFCQCKIRLGLPKGKKPYYFKKQIEVAEKLLKTIK